MNKMDDNWRTSIGYICIALVCISWVLGGAWILSPQEFTFKIEIDNNTRDAFESIDYEAISEKNIEYAPIECFFNETHYNETCVNKFANGGLDE
jgi:hypothetical protein